MKKLTVEEERILVDSMIDLYAAAHCRNSQIPDAEVPDTEALKDYAHRRIEQCRYRNEPEKPFCNVCPVHCYKPEMRRQIRSVMRYSGPRILLRHPFLSVAHLIGTIRSKKKPPPLPGKRAELRKEDGDV